VQYTPLRVGTLSGEGQPVSRNNKAAWKKASPELATVLAIIELERRDQLEICDCLELVADQLPEQVDLALYEFAHEKLLRKLPIYHQNEEALFERIGEHASATIDVPSILECVRREHAIHNCYADELYENLNDLRAGKRPQDPATVGYMLRFCFDSIRRHLAWEDLAVMPLAMQIVNPDDLATLVETVRKNRKGIGLEII